MLSPNALLSVSVPPLPVSPKVTSVAKGAEEKKDHPIYLFGWEKMSLLRHFQNYLFQMRFTKLVGNPIQPHDTPAVKYVYPVMDFARKLLLDEDSPPLWTYDIQEKDALGKVMILGLGSRSPTSRWIPLLDLPNRDQSYGAHSQPEVPDINWDVERKCICVMVFLKPGTIDWEDTVYRPTVSLHTNDTTADLFRCIRRLCTQHQSAFALLTDGIYLGMVDNRERDRHHERTSGEWYGWKYDLHPVTEFTVRMALAFFILSEVEMLELFYFPELRTYHLVQGCLDHEIPGISKSVGAIPSPKRFRDFDYFALQRDKNLWHRFCEWKTKASRAAKVLQVGLMLRVECGGFNRYHPVIRSPFPNQPVPQDTLAIVARAKRDRVTALDTLLVPNTKHSFNITRVIRAGPKMFSQVFVGTLNGHELCLKLFDERFFPTPQPNEFHVRDEDGDEDSDDDPAFRLWSLNFADDMMRREEGVYLDRLKYMQGSLIPHCYGFHYFKLPDGHKVLGMLLEVIHGLSLYEINLSKQPEPIQRDMVTRIRHAVRAMAYAGVMQGDWHSNQILCPPSQDIIRNPSSLVRHELVLIDFAFAKQRYGEDVGCPPEYSHPRAMAMLLEAGIRRDICDQLWFGMDEEEF